MQHQSNKTPHYEEEIDLVGIVGRFLRAWPLFAVSVIIWFGIGLVFQSIFPPLYTAKTSVLIENPQATADPDLLILGSHQVEKVGAYHFINEKVAIQSFSLMNEIVEELNLTTAYFRAGLVFDSEIYQNSPIIAKIDSSTISQKHLRPFNTPFYVTIKDGQQFSLEVEGEYPVTEEEYYFTGDFTFGEWIELNGVRFQVKLAPQKILDQVAVAENIYEESYAFMFKETATVVYELKENMEVVSEEVDATIIGVSLSGSVPNKQIDFLNALTEKYLAEHLDNKTEVLTNAISFLETELALLSTGLSNSENLLSNYKTNKNITNLGTEARLLLEESAKLESDKGTYLVRKKYYDYLAEYLDDNENYDKLVSPLAFGINDPLLNKLTNELVSLQIDKNAILSGGKNAQAILESIDQKMAAHRKTIIETVTGFQASNEMLLGEVTSRLGKLAKDAKRIPKTEQQLLVFERQYKLNESLYLSLKEKKSEAEIRLASVSPDLKIVDPARTTTLEEIFPIPLVTFAVAFILGLLCPILWITLKTLFNQKVQTKSEIQKHTDVPVLGSFPNQFGAKTNLVSAYPQSKLAESLRQLYSQFGAIESEKDRLLVVSSIQSGEGKTFVAGNLATVLALDGKRVVLVDANLRSPGQHSLFQTSNVSGLSDYLQGKAELSAVIRNTETEGLSLISAGVAGSNPAALLSGESFQDLLNYLLNEFDIVLLDTPALGLVADARLAMQTAGRNLFVVRRGKSNYESLENINELVNAGDISKLGLAFNDTLGKLEIIPSKTTNRYYQEPKVSIFKRLWRAIRFA